ncbi:protein of unknown function [Pedococcus dokdonensis]|uniref:DUF4386 family protein n=1 Tax=Pedococcus dokdonensis TaxID=443156 RepID=A0A1H0MMC3_9MICO|nr:DUF4386 family protein [Pedococcus dokdonensis]SDO81552.1 protein of unknown function [Pedococcus dokdonensis]
MSTSHRATPTPIRADGSRHRIVAAVSMTSAAVLATAGFTALGSVFDYPDILKEPTATILDRYREHPTTVSAWFLVLTVSAALLAPTAVSLGRLVAGRLGRWVTGVGVAAAVVQVVGLSRWVLFVPGLSSDARRPDRAADALHRFELLHTWLGEALGETVGYALTATFTLLVIRGLGQLPRRVRLLGASAAVLVATGVLIQLGLEVAELTNFVGYLAWSLWLVVLSVVLWRGRR